MSKINVLDQNTINQIAAGEVIERPSSVVKELVENALDAGAGAVTVEIKEGGISLIRVTDNGEGIPASEIPTAFLRHTTSKIAHVEDLLTISSLGFRGEALSSIASIARVELITRTQDSLTGTRYRIEGGVEVDSEEIGAPGGTTFLVRDLFYNTPARRKFLKTAATEASYISSLMEHLALSHPNVSFRLLVNNQNRLHTSGNGNLKDIIYTIYGRDITQAIVPIDFETENVHIRGFVGKPEINRGNRTFETYFINGRYVKSVIITKGLENAYRGFVMQHKYPFAVFHMEIDQAFLDVNVHPTKMELRFRNEEEVYQAVYTAARNALTGRELIPTGTFREEEKEIIEKQVERGPEPFEAKRQTASAFTHASGHKEDEQKTYPAFQSSTFQVREKVAYEPSTIEKMQQNIRNSLIGNRQVKEQTARPEPAGEEAAGSTVQSISMDPAGSTEEASEEAEEAEVSASVSEPAEVSDDRAAESEKHENIRTLKPKQLNLFEEKILTASNRQEYRLIGQLFDTYWLIQYKDTFLIMDQHAAHEKVLYEKTMRRIKDQIYLSQEVQPPIILTLNARQREVISEFEENFARFGFRIEPFGGREYAVYAVPANMFGIARSDALTELIDTLADESAHTEMTVIEEKIAMMSCKAAVKGNNHLSFAEAEALVDELMNLDNPYMCPHGRPTIITMTKYELEKKFKRIIS